MNPLRRLLLGTGRLPADLRATLGAEGISFLAEGLAGSVTYRNYRAPGQRSSWRKEAVSGAIAVSSRRLVVWAGRGKHIDVPLSGPLLATLGITSEAPDRVRFGYDAGRFSSTRSGTVEVSLRTPQATRVAELLTPPL
ncbi:hypothetical protein I6A60_27410 [Frankia sp. AgB1.9]|uniref:hypothetical protein n=1 Tax=unclassified Frankia TaxID=2632575 RepID=UPI00193148A0|nr:MULTISPECIES: hypothetical protein [unclassified Frankia]MBL7491136.1 hypothetical protein [Frankia sp. AgW1.1]MBL7551557.1 hypothetical protein [Frankia sp. AgB1.9]MBL7621796.1 hypothetical protein [Frankia sp. AgB1.8]